MIHRLTGAVVLVIWARRTSDNIGIDQITADAEPTLPGHRVLIVAIEH